MQTSTSLADTLGRYLDLASDQLKLTAGNIANLDTPGYKTQGFDFEQEFRRQQDGLSDTAAEAQPRTVSVDGLVARPDGNNVSMDREGVQLAKAQLKFRMGIELLKHEFAGVLAAIHADSK